MDFFCVGMNAWSDGIMTLEELEEVGDCLGVCGWAWLCSAFKQFSYVHFAREMDLPWNKNSPTMLEARPNDPTITRSLGFDMSGSKGLLTEQYGSKEPRIPGVVKNRPIASRDIEKQRARRKTPLTRAARISALCHPYEYRESEELSLVS